MHSLESTGLARLRLGQRVTRERTKRKLVASLFASRDKLFGAVVGTNFGTVVGHTIFLEAVIWYKDWNLTIFGTRFPAGHGKRVFFCTVWAGRFAFFAHD